MQSNWSRALSITTQELDFLQPGGFPRFPKATMVYHLNQKITLMDQIFFFQNLYCRFISDHFGHA